MVYYIYSKMILFKVGLIKLALILVYLSFRPLSPCPEGQRRFNGSMCSSSVSESLKNSLKGNLTFIFLGDSLFNPQDSAVAFYENGRFPNCSKSELKQMSSTTGWALALDRLKEKSIIDNVTILNYAEERAPIIPIGSNGVYGRSLSSQVGRLRVKVEEGFFVNKKVVIAVSIIGNDLLRFVNSNGRLPDVNLIIEILGAQFKALLQMIPQAEIIYHFPLPATWLPIAYSTPGGLLFSSIFIDSFIFGIKPRVYQLADENSALSIYDPAYIPVSPTIHEEPLCVSFCGNYTFDWKDCMWFDDSHFSFKGFSLIADDVIYRFLSYK